jgi:DNA adenine methylase
MAAFSAVQSDVDSLVKELKDKRYKYDRRVYLRIRAEDPTGFDQIRRAARFIYLNRTCFNGLYRVNRDGEFNTPFGKYDNPLICDEENLRAVAKSLKGVKLMCADFETIVEKVEPGDGVYFDPPYLPISKTASFTSYNAGGFRLGDHARLAFYFKALVKMGVNVVLSNSLSDVTRDMYSGFDVRELTGARNVGGPAEYRKSVTEMMVVGGPAKTGEKVA